LLHFGRRPAVQAEWLKVKELLHFGRRTAVQADKRLKIFDKVNVKVKVKKSIR